MELAIIDVFKTNAKAQLLAPITAGLVGATVTVNLSPDWDSYTLSHVWTGCGRCILDTTASGVIPYEVVETEGGVVKFGIYGTKDGVETPTIWVNLGLVKCGPDPSGDPSTDPTLPVWAQLNNRVSRLEQADSSSGPDVIIVDDEGYLTTTSGGFTVDSDGYILL